MSRTLTIGLPIHEEEKTLREFFVSLTKAIDPLPQAITVETIACLNGSGDNSEAILESLKTEYAGHRANLSVIHSEKGKLRAQTKIAESRQTNGPISFIDSDILISPNTLSSLLDSLEKNSDLYVTYAHVDPIYDRNHGGTIFEDVLHTHYAYRHLQPQRKYFHGRAFMMRDASTLKSLWDDVPERVAAIGNDDLAKKLTLAEGPLVDDIYLSRVIAHKYGVGSIREVQDAHVYFHPPSSFNDYFKALKRTRVEITRLNLLYPEHAYLQERHFERKRDARAFELMPEGEARKYKHLCEVEDLLNAVVDTGFDLSNTPAIPDRWINVPSTKKSFNTQGWKPSHG